MPRVATIPSGGEGYLRLTDDGVLMVNNPQMMTVEAAAGFQDSFKRVLTWTNYGPVDMVFSRMEVQNGATAGDTTAAAVSCTTPNGIYTATYPATAMPANAVMSVDTIWEDRIAPGETLYVTIETAPGTAQEFEARVILQNAALA